jgi:universal stress protein E
MFNKIMIFARDNDWAQTPLTKKLMLSDATTPPQVIFLDVLPEVPAGLTLSGRHTARMQKEAVNTRMREINDVLAGAVKEKLKPAVKVLTGKPFVEIIKEVVRTETDLLIIPLGRKRKTDEPLLGSTELHLIRKCPCPVWLVKPGRRKKYRKIMAAVDIDSDNPENTSLSGKILETAAFLAGTEGGELHVMHAWNLFQENMLLYRARLSHATVDRLSRKFGSDRQSRVVELIERSAPGTSAERIHIVKGDAARLIPEVAKREKIELIVMGSVGRTGIAGFFIGNTAEAILHRVDCSVLALKPEGFITPVQALT